MGLFSPISDFARGFRTYKRGLSWLKSHPAYALILLLPMCLGIAVMAYGWSLFVVNHEQWVGMVLFAEPTSPWLMPLYYLCKVILYLAVFLLGLLVYMLIANILASPIYEYVSVAVEKDLTPGRAVELTLWESIKLIGEEVKKVLFIILISVALLFIPILNVISFLITAFLIGWDFYDYPLARRGWSFGRRLRFVVGDFWAVMGFGIWLMIPFVQIILLPMAVAGGSMLSIERLAKEVSSD